MLPDYLYLTPAEAQASRELEQAWSKSPGNCDSNPAAWVDYPGYNTPTRLEARYMCTGCPVFTECEKFARLLKPTHGVWAGKVYTKKEEN